MLNQILLWQATIVGWARDRVSNKDDTGASLVEYALLLALIAVVAIGALAFLGHAVSSTLNNVANTISGTTPTTT
jgi:pilus assembly protein Flp/PilA